MNARQLLKTTVFMLIVILLLFPANTLAARKTFNMGIITDGPLARFQEVIAMYQREITDMASSEFDVRFPADKQLDGGWTRAGINQAIDQLLADSQVDIVITLGEVTTHEVCRRRNLSKPVIAPLVIDAEIQQLPDKNGTSGVKNLSYINTYRNFNRAIKRFQEVVPFKRLAIMVDQFTIESIPGLQRLVGPVARQAQIRIELVRVSTSAEEALLRIPPGVDAVFTTALPRFSQGEFQKLTEGLIERRLPSMTVTDYEEVLDGILATTVPSSSKQQLARNVAINTYEIMRGEPAGSLSTAFSEDDVFTINMATARAIGIQPGWRVLTEAELINEDEQDRERRYRYTLYGAVKEALKANLDFAAAGKRVTAGESSVKERRSGLLPQIGISSQARVIDEDRAAASLGLMPERLWTGSAIASQLIYSDRTWAGYEIEKHLQYARVEELETVKLDLMQLAATAYLNVLRVKSIERIQKENLKLTRANLERARVRQSTGVAGPEEVYRWEAQIANSQQLVLLAESTTLDAVNAVNRILNRPLEAPFVPEEVDYADPLTTLGSSRPQRYLANAKTLNEMRAFLLVEGLAAAPEIKQLEAAMEARQRSLTFARRDFWLPRFELVGDVTEEFDRSGAGSDLRSEADSTSWTAGVSGSLPLFTSGRKTATLSRTREELAGLKLQRDATEQRVEERIYNATHLVRASYPRIELSRDAARAAQLNLELITDKYSRGTKSIIDLIDAQNQALTADQQAVNAVYDFLIDMMSVQRSISRFLFYESIEDQNAWYDRLDAFIAEKRKPRSTFTK